MDTVTRVVGFVVGVAIITTTAASMFTTLVIPRASSARLLRSVTSGLGALLRIVVHRLQGYESKDRAIAIVGPLGLVIVFAIWLLAFVGGYGLVIWWVSGASLLSALGLSGSSITTLGILVGRSGPTRALQFVVGGTGLLVVALEIAYLPALYNAFSSREAEVTLLATRAGVPAWGPEIIRRHYRFRTVAELPDLYRTWERWAAEVSESHASYPSLMWFRSPDPRRSWLTAMVAMLDAAALHDSLCPHSAPPQARLYLQMGTSCLRSLASALRMPFDPDPLPTAGIRLTKEEFLEGVGRLIDVDFPAERGVEDAWPHFAGWRVNYESIVDQMTAVIVPPPSPWQMKRPELGEVVWPHVINRTPEHPGGAELGKG